MNIYSHILVPLLGDTGDSDKQQTNGKAGQDHVIDVRVRGGRVSVAHNASLQALCDLSIPNLDSSLFLTQAPA